MSRSNGKVTLQDIAQATGYTVNTVSRALKNKPDISRQTCEQIQKVARQMGYVRNYIASSLRSGRTKTIAMITGTMVNPFYAILGDFIQQEAVRLGYGLMILCSRDDPEIEMQMVEMALSRQVDGILIAPCSADSPSLPMLREARIPFVLLSRYQHNREDDYVICDDEQGGYLAGKYLIDRGHHRLGMISFFHVVYSSHQRFLGFHRAGLEAGIPEEDILYAEEHEEQALISTLCDWKEKGITGLFSFCDVEAWNLLSLMETIKSDTPAPTDLIGFDNIQGYMKFPRPIPSIDCNLQEEARIAIDLLRNRIHDPDLPPQRRVLPVSLICR